MIPKQGHLSQKSQLFNANVVYTLGSVSEENNAMTLSYRDFDVFAKCQSYPMTHSSWLGSLITERCRHMYTAIILTQWSV